MTTIPALRDTLNSLLQKRPVPTGSDRPSPAEINGLQVALDLLQQDPRARDFVWQDSEPGKYGAGSYRPWSSAAKTLVDTIKRAGGESTDKLVEVVLDSADDGSIPGYKLVRQPISSSTLFILKPT